MKIAGNLNPTQKAELVAVLRKYGYVRLKFLWITIAFDKLADQIEEYA